MSIRRSLFAAAVLGAAGVTPAIVPAAAQAPFRLGHVLAESHSWHVNATGFAQEVEARTQGRVKIQVFPGGQLGAETRVIEGLQLGSVQMGLIGAGSFQTLEPKMGIVELPYTWPSRQHAYRAYDGELGAALAGLMEAKNIVILGWWETGLRHVTTRDRPVRTPADLRGVKIRVTPDRMRLETFKAMGAEPAPLAFGELYSALQQGVFDAQENPLSIIWSASFFEVQKQLSLTGHVYGPAALAISRASFQRLSADDQAVLRSAAATWGAKQRADSQAADAAAIDQLKAKGMTVTEVDQAPFVAAVKPVWDEFGRIYGPELLALLARYRN
jgi:tripartite ATP-independent transporter DctP family solute receptor